MNKKFLLDYLRTNSPSTYEQGAQKVWLDFVSEHTLDIEKDLYGNVIAKLPQKNSDNKFKVVIDAHCDEIGWRISSIDKNGFLRVKRNGGTDNEITPNTNVIIMTEKGNVKGVFGTTPIHLKDKENPYKPTEESLYIDVFATNEDEVEDLGIEIGNYVVFDRQPELIGDKYVIGKSLDDKIGGFIIAEVLQKIVSSNIELPYDLYVVNSVQEEVGLRGAKMITEKIKPDVAVCFDVHFDTNTPNIDKEKHGETKIGDGLIFRGGYDVHPNFLKLMKKVAKENTYKYKLVIGGAGGTNTHSYNLSNGGVVTGTLSIPLRYMHTPNELVSLLDVITATDYLVDLLMSIKPYHDFNLVK